MPAITPFGQQMQFINRQVVDRLADVVANIAGAQVPALFEAAYQLADVGIVGMATAQPAITVLVADLPAALQADAVRATVVLPQGSYTVAAYQPDGAGAAVLLLEAA